MAIWQVKVYATEEAGQAGGKPLGRYRVEADTPADAKLELAGPLSAICRTHKIMTLWLNAKEVIRMRNPT